MRWVFASRHNPHNPKGSNWLKILRRTGTILAAILEKEFGQKGARPLTEGVSNLCVGDGNDQES